MNEEQITEVLYSQELETLLTVVRDKFAFLESSNEHMRKKHTELCVAWVNALGNPADPQELDKAIAETPKLRSADYAHVPSTIWEEMIAELEQLRAWKADAEGDAAQAEAAKYKALWASVPWKLIQFQTECVGDAGLAHDADIIQAWLDDNVPEDGEVKQRTPLIYFEDVLIDPEA